MKCTGICVIHVLVVCLVKVSGYTDNLSDWLHAQQDLIMKYLTAPMPTTEPLLTQLDLFNERFTELVKRLNEKDATLWSYARRYVLSDGPPHINYYIDDDVFTTKYKWKFKDISRLLDAVYLSYSLWVEYAVYYAKGVFWFHTSVTPSPGWANIDDIPDYNTTWFSTAND